MDAFRRFMDTHCPAPRTDAEAIHLGDGRVRVGDASVKLTRKYHVKALEYLVKHRNADTNDPTICTSNPSIPMKQLCEINGGRLAPFLTLIRSVFGYRGINKDWWASAARLSPTILQHRHPWQIDSRLCHRGLDR